MKIEIIKIDRDFRSYDKNRYWIKRMESLGEIIESKKTRHGWHWKVRLFKPIRSMKHYFEMRYWLGDDNQRIVKDIFKYWHGYKKIDILFDKKWSGW